MIGKIAAKDRQRFGLVFLYSTGPHIARRRRRLLPSQEPRVAAPPPFAGLTPSEKEKTTLSCCRTGRNEEEEEDRSFGLGFYISSRFEFKPGQADLIHAEAQKQRRRKFVAGHGAAGGDRAFLQVVHMR